MTMANRMPTTPRDENRAMVREYKKKESSSLCNDKDKNPLLNSFLFFFCTLELMTSPLERADKIRKILQDKEKKHPDEFQRLRIHKAPESSFAYESWSTSTFLTWDEHKRLRAWIDAQDPFVENALGLPPVLTESNLAPLQEFPYDDSLLMQRVNEASSIWTKLHRLWGVEKKGFDPADYVHYLQKLTGHVLEVLHSIQSSWVSRLGPQEDDVKSNV